MKLNVARNVREAKGANERGMALLAKATAEVRIERFFYTFSAQRWGRDDGEFRRGGFFTLKTSFSPRRRLALVTKFGELFFFSLSLEAMTNEQRQKLSSVRE